MPRSIITATYPALSDDNIVRLHDGQPSAGVTKMGMLPFIRNEQGELEFLVMKPRTTPGHPGGPPMFQIGKGTRQGNNGEGWQDIGRSDLVVGPDTQLEKLQMTAAREGREELGVKTSNIRRMYDAGEQQCIKESSGKPMTIHVFAAALKCSPDQARRNAYFVRPHAGTQEVKWMTTAQMEGEVRADHLAIIKTVEKQVERQLKTEKPGPHL